MSEEKITRVAPVEKNGIAAKPKITVNQDHFEALMNQRRVETDSTAKQTEKIEPEQSQTLFDEVQKLNHQTQYAVHSAGSELELKARDLIAQIDDVKHKLQTPDLKIEGPIRNVLNSKLNHINDSLKVALNKAGLEYHAPERPTSLSSPVSRFLGMLSHGQDQLETLASDVKSMSEGTKDINPANMLLVQIKVTSVQQEIELFTSMLNKSLEGIKTMMNVQV